MAEQYAAHASYRTPSRQPTSSQQRQTIASSATQSAAQVTEDTHLHGQNSSQFRPAEAKIQALPRNLTAEIRAQHDAKFIAGIATGPTPADIAAAHDADIIPLSAEERQQMEIEGRQGWKGFECPICGYDTSLRRLLLHHIRREHYDWWLKNGANVK